MNNWGKIKDREIDFIIIYIIKNLLAFNLEDSILYVETYRVK